MCDGRGMGCVIEKRALDILEDGGKRDKGVMKKGCIGDWM